MSFENLANLVRAIKGASASIVVALLFARRPMTTQELQHWTGYPTDSINQATWRLVQLGWVSALGTRGPWSLRQDQKLLLTGWSEAGIPRAGSADLGGQESPERDPMDADDKEEEGFVRSLHTLFDAGIREPTAGRLARLPYVTPEYVAAHVALANAQGYHLGVAIYRMEHGWPMPKAKAVLTVEDRIRKFLDDP